MKGMSAEGSTFHRVSYYCWTVVTLALMFGFGYLPPFGSLEHLGMQVLGVFMGLLVGWLTVGFVWPSLLAIVALGLSDYTSFTGAFKAGFGNNTTVIILLMFIFAAYLNQAGVSDFIAKWFLSRRSLIGHPWRFTFAIWLSAYLICVATYVYPAILLMWNITYDICLRLGYKQGDRYPMVVCIGVVVFAGLGYQALPIKAIALMTYGALTSVSGGAYGLHFLGYTVFLLVFTVLSALIFLAVVKYLLKPDMTLLEQIDEQTFAQYRTERMLPETKRALWALIAFIVLMVLSCVIPKTFPVLGPALRSFTVLGCITVLLAALQIIHVDGQPVMDFTRAAQSKDISWQTVIMFAGTMPVADAMTSEEVGIMACLQQTLTPYFSIMTPLVFTVAIITVSIIATQFLHNVVICVMMVPIMYVFAPSIGASPAVLALMISVACCCATATPAASAPAAMEFLNTAWIRTRTLYWLNTLLVAGNLLTLIVLIPLAKWLVG